MILPLTLLFYDHPASEAEESLAFRFETVDLFADSGDRPLAAYQLEFKDATGRSLLTGIEGGEHDAFQEPPYYDPAALKQNRAILAAFSTAQELPTGKTRIATLHVMVRGDEAAEYTATLKLAADRDGNKFSARVAPVIREAK